jgi:hypothetical protein
MAKNPFNTESFLEIVSVIEIYADGDVPLLRPPDNVACRY